MTLLKWLLGKSSNEVEGFLERGAIIIDVRSKEEFKSGHIKNSLNIPLQNIPETITKIRKFNKPVIVCCQSGMRSAQAASLLKKRRNRSS